MCNERFVRGPLLSAAVKHCRVDHATNFATLSSSSLDSCSLSHTATTTSVGWKEMMRRRVEVYE